MSRSRPGSSREARAAEMRRTIESFEASGLSRAAFCRARGVPMSTFLYWRRRLAAKSPFVEVELVGAGAVSAAVEITAPGGAVIRLTRDADEDLIRRVLRAASTSC
jgi:hypothetical protein